MILVLAVLWNIAKLFIVKSHCSPFTYTISGLRVNPVGGGLGLGVAAAADNVDGGVAALNPLVEGGDGQEEENDSGLDNMGADEPQVNRIVKRKKTMSLI